MFAVPLTLGPAAAALGVGLSKRFALVLTSQAGAGRAAVATEICATLFAVGAALWSPQ